MNCGRSAAHDNSGIIMVESLDIKRFGLPLMVRNFPIRTFADDLADAIANPSPSRPFRDAVGRAGRDVCDAFSNVPPWARTIPGAIRDLAGVCAPYWDDQGIDPPVSAPPFTGGQCPGVRYTVTGTFVNNTTGPSCGLTENWTAGNPFGPILGITNDGTFWYLNTGGSSGAFVAVTRVGGGRLVVGSPPCANSPGPGNQRASEVKITSVVPVSGGANNCGDPPPELQPGPNPSPRNPVIPPELQPVDDPVSGPQLPVPDLPSLPGLPDIPFRNPFADRPAVDPIDPGTPGTPEGTGDGAGGAGGGEAEGEAPEGTELVGLKIDFTQPPVGAREYADGVFRAVGYVYMGGPQGLDQDQAGASIRSGQFVYAERPGLTKWRVAANIGFYLTVTPFYVERE